MILQALYGQVTTIESISCNYRQLKLLYSNIHVFLTKIPQGVKKEYNTIFKLDNWILFHSGNIIKIKKHFFLISLRLKDVGLCIMRCKNSQFLTYIFYDAFFNKFKFLLL